LAVGYISSPYLNTYTWNELNNRFELNNTIDTIPEGIVYGVAFSNDGEILGIVHSGGSRIKMYLWNETTSRYEFNETANLMLPNTGLGIDISANNMFLAAAHYGLPYITVYLIGSGEILSPALLMQNFDYLTNNKYIGILNEDGNIGETKVATMLWGDNV